MYDSNLADTLNREPGEGEGEGDEAEAVQKQTAETLIAGEKIMEAIELADADRAATRQWQVDNAKSNIEIPRPPRNAELIARGDLEPDEYVLKVVQKLPAAQMEDALLVLPFRMVVSLMGYLDEWAMQVRTTYLSSKTVLTDGLTGQGNYLGVSDPVLPSSNTLFPDCIQPHYANAPSYTPTSLA